MGNDGGSIPDRRDLVRNKPKAEQADKANQTRAKWFFCALSKRPLQEPVVSCALGKLYNKDSILEYLLDRSAYGDGEEICGHIRSLKDVKVLKLTPRAASAPLSNISASTEVPQYVCPLTFKEMNGVQPFVYILTCGCVFSQAGLRTVLGASPETSVKVEKVTKDKMELDSSLTEKEEQLEICPQCAIKFSRTMDILTLNPSLEEEERMRVAMDIRRAKEPQKTKSKKRKADVGSGIPVDDASASASTKRKKGSPDTLPAIPSAVPTITTTSRSLASSLAEEEAKRKANMSDAVKSLFRGKNDAPRKETFMTMGTFTRYA
ncbi:Rtf2 RING-finger-domain-containing protein [Hygrophoropsis aurantiaca]|uniref:Rtf2 RING-finger-domain-containing protein n=1 Tax=Hygrophoropsis aurantiaca TaxID=72124 RepID=A0ACB8AAK8_9AGAM|nr:Rtf2 RING-finger-domain-containing protein [Hygrophoropsis aurantiaca]